ncbi:hypothetical protein ABPG75_008658 [Micractinium tetrahymenae]
MLCSRPLLAAARTSSAGSGTMLQRCWACGVLCCPPHVGDGQEPRLFKCGWCAAVNASTTSGAAPATADPAAPRLQLAGPRRCPRLALPLAAGRTLVAMVLLLVGCIFVIGASVVQPAVYGPDRSPLHLALAVLLAFNSLFHYAACTLRAPGAVPAHLRRTALDASGSVRRGALEGCRYCEACAFYKPPAAHHCRSCGCCVVEMDHHCWYLNSCVGADTLRHFILLLLWLAAALAYCLGLGLAMGTQQWPAILAHTRRVARGGGQYPLALRLPFFSLTWLFSAPPRLGWWAFFTTVSIGALIGVSSLLARQLRLLLRGQTHLQALQGRASAGAQLRRYERQQLQVQQVEQVPGLGDAGLPTAAVVAPSSAAAEPEHVDPAADHGQTAPSSTESGAMRNVRRVFGPGHPLTWLLPSLRAPPTAGSSRAKAH